MSTAIALQDLHGPHTTEQTTGILRQRSTSKGDRKSSFSTQEDDDWVNSPHDAASAALPLDSRSFVPTTVYWVSPHGLLSKEIKMLDLTRDMTVPFTDFSDAYKNEVKKTLKDHSFTPCFTAHRTNWLGLKYTITDDQGKHIADWKHPWTSVNEATLTFPDESPHAPHPISLRNKRWGLRTEAFTLNSVPFFWEANSLWHSTYMTLYKVYGSGEEEKKIVVGRYAQKWWGSFVTGGILVIDDAEVDGLVACLTLCVVLKKKRQRAAERNPGAGGGGGGGG